MSVIGMPFPYHASVDPSGRSHCCHECPKADPPPESHSAGVTRQPSAGNKPLEVHSQQRNPQVTLWTCPFQQPWKQEETSNSKKSTSLGPQARPTWGLPYPALSSRRQVQASTMSLIAESLRQNYIWGGVASTLDRAEPEEQLGIDSLDEGCGKEGTAPAPGSELPCRKQPFPHVLSYTSQPHSLH